MKLNRLIPLLLLAACAGDPSGIDPADVLLTVSVDGNAPPSETNVEVQVRNEADENVYLLDHCGELLVPVFEKRVGTEWELAPYGVPCLAVVTPPIELAPGESTAWSLAIHDPGQYRATVRVSAGRGRSTDVRYSFTVGE